jgi:hypothetical protein
MTNSDYEEFQGIWHAVCEIYSKSPSDMAVGLAFRSLAAYDLQDVKRAITTHAVDADQGRFMPKPADIVRHIDGDPKSRSLGAWSKVESAVRNIGPYRDVVFDDPLIAQVVIDMGGWIELNNVTEDELPFKRNEFSARYSGYITRPPANPPGQLTGLANAHNEEKHKELPFLVGDKEKAKEVMLLGLQKPGLITSPFKTAGESLQKLGFDDK